MSLREFISLATPFFKGELVLKKDFDASQARVQELTTSHGTVTGELTTARARIVELEGKLTAAELQVTTLQGELTTEKAKSADFEKKVAAAGGQQAAQVMASLGVKPLNIKPDEQAAGGGQSLLEQFQAITDPKERAAFWAKHGGLEGILGKKK